jgi:hypothetical protein
MRTLHCKACNKLLDDLEDDLCFDCLAEAQADSFLDVDISDFLITSNSGWITPPVHPQLSV